MRVSRLLLICLIAATFVAMPTAVRAAGYARFTSRALHFSIDYPKTWRAEAVVASNYATFYPRTSEYTGITVNWYAPSRHLGPHELANALAAEYKKRLAARIGAISYVGNRGYFGGAVEIKKHHLQFRAETIVISRQGYSFVAIAKKADMDSVIANFDHMRRSFSAL